jgi:hypothetical protein
VTDPSSGSSAPRDTHVTTGTGQRRVVGARGEAAGIGGASAKGKAVVSSAQAIARAAFPDQTEAIDTLVQQFAARSDPHLIAAKADPTSYVGNTNLREQVVSGLAQDELDRRKAERLAEEAERAQRRSFHQQIALRILGGIVALLVLVVGILLKALFFPSS